MNQKVTVIGAGRMGSALAAALYRGGFDTAVWNRTSSKTESLSRLGLRVAPSVLEAVGSAEIVMVNINSYESTNQLARQLSPCFAAKPAPLSSGTPDEAREMESWAQPRGKNPLPGDAYPTTLGDLMDCAYLASC
jgi:3-hydroxyisobutyrate dehydrogenase-like beta-hydroxyacid dehydrogenase